MFLNLPQMWLTTTGSSIEYIDYHGPYYSYNTNAIEYTLTPEDIQDFANGLFSSAISTSEADGWFSSWGSMEITAPVKRRSAKMG